MTALEVTIATTIAKMTFKRLNEKSPAPLGATGSFDASGSRELSLVARPLITKDEGRPRFAAIERAAKLLHEAPDLAHIQR